MPPRSGGICGRLTEDLPSTRPQGAGRRAGCAGSQRVSCGCDFCVQSGVQVFLQRLLSAFAGGEAPCVLHTQPTLSHSPDTKHGGSKKINGTAVGRTRQM